MHHALQLPQVSHLVQVGIRDFSEGEADTADFDARIHPPARQAYRDRVRRRLLDSDPLDERGTL